MAAALCFTISGIGDRINGILLLSLTHTIPCLIAGLGETPSKPMGKVHADVVAVAHCVICNGENFNIPVEDHRFAKLPSFKSCSLLPLDQQVSADGCQGGASIYREAMGIRRCSRLRMFLM
ncbi:MAG: hypothetical protein IPO36_18590 [Anaerolineales bacterium]|nr:hypothetical protein [Anaerolineales bacterium]